MRALADLSNSVQHMDKNNKGTQGNKAQKKQTLKDTCNSGIIFKAIFLMSTKIVT
jgi:hypothetical protein